MSNNSKPISTIERQVMAGVGTAYAGRQLTSVGALKIYALILSLWEVGRLVWVSKIFENFLQVEKNGVGSVFNYSVYALEHTHFAVQLTLLVAAVAGLSLVVDTLRSFNAPRNIFA